MHPEQLPSPKVSLAFFYEKHAEPHFTAEKRALHPYKVFRTFNFMILRETFLKHPFDETITHYGHEDTLFGLVLKKERIKILHIDNPLMNCGLDTNLDVLLKTEESLRTLYMHSEKLKDCSEILRLYGLLRDMHLLRSVSFLYHLCRPMIRRNLLGKHPNLYCFAFYKIGYYCNLAKERK